MWNIFLINETWSALNNIYAMLDCSSVKHKDQKPFFVLLDVNEFQLFSNILKMKFKLAN